MDKRTMSKVIIGTGNYANTKSGNTLSVTGDGGNSWGYYGHAYKKLAPKFITYMNYASKYIELLNIKDDKDKLAEYKILRKKIEDEYIKDYYETRLKDLNIEELYETLYRKYSDNIILLCHESIDEFCHRRLIADYIEIKTGIYIPEVSTDKEGKVKELTPIRYTDRLKALM